MTQVPREQARAHPRSSCWRTCSPPLGGAYGLARGETLDGRDLEPAWVAPARGALVPAVVVVVIGVIVAAMRSAAAARSHASLPCCGGRVDRAAARCATCPA